jgi:hypothetical protein
VHRQGTTLFFIVQGKHEHVLPGALSCLSSATDATSHWNSTVRSLDRLSGVTPPCPVTMQKFGPLVQQLYFMEGLISSPLGQPWPLSWTPQIAKKTLCEQKSIIHSIASLGITFVSKILRASSALHRVLGSCGTRKGKLG